MHNNINVNVSGPMQPTSTYKTKVLKGNHSFASQVTEPDTKYVIKHNFDLGGESVTIPENCVLEFDGGSISNGKIINSNFYIKADRQSIFKNIYFFNTISGLELLNDGVSVKVTQNNKFFNVYTKKKAVIDEVVNIGYLYVLSNETSTTDSGDDRVVTIDDTTYTVNVAEFYSYKARSIIGINDTTGSMLTGELLEDRSIEKFYKYTRLNYNNSSSIKNVDIYPEWFKDDSHVDDTLCLSIASLVASLGKNNLLCESRFYNISDIIPIRRGCKLIGVFGDIWENGTNIIVNCPIGLFIYDIEAVSIKVENITFIYGENYKLNYTGIELQTATRNVVINNVNFKGANVAININAYCPVQYTVISNVSINTCNSVLIADGCFKARGNVYVNGNYFNIKSTSSVNQVGMKFIKCDGNNVQFTASESLGSPSFYFDNSEIEIMGMSWNESSSYIQAYNNSFVSIVGEGFAYGSTDCDSTSVIIRRKDTYRYNSIIEENLNLENNIVDFLRIDGINRRYVDRYGKQIAYIPDNVMTYKDGKYYITGEVGIQDYNISPVGKTLLIKVKSHTAGSINLGFVNIVLKNTKFRNYNLLAQCGRVNCGYFNVNAESIIYVTVTENGVSVNGREEVEYTGSFDTIATTGGTMVSDILIVNGNMPDLRGRIAYKKVIDNSNIPNIPKYPDTVYGQKEWYRPIILNTISTYDIYKIDINNNRYVNCKGDTVAVIPNATVKRNINGKYYITRSFNQSNLVSINNDYQKDLKNKTLLVEFATLEIPLTDDSNYMNFGFKRLNLRYNTNDSHIKLYTSSHYIMNTDVGEHIIGLKCTVEEIEGIEKNIFTSINNQNFPFEGDSSLFNEIMVFGQQSSLLLYVADIMIVDKVIESDQEFLYYQNILRNSRIPNNDSISGSFNFKPSSPAVGTKYFCTSGASIDGGTTEKPNIPIYYTGSGWVDSNGTAVVAYNG